MQVDWMRVLAIVVIAYLGFETFRGWQTGRIEFRALMGDRAKAPAIYWFLMSTNVLLIVGAILAVLGIYGDL